MTTGQQWAPVGPASGPTRQHPSAALDGHVAALGGQARPRAGFVNSLGIPFAEETEAERPKRCPDWHKVKPVDGAPDRSTKQVHDRLPRASREMTIGTTSRTASMLPGPSCRGVFMGSPHFG